ncbi:MAG: TIGR02117 family protein [Planctomycetes bacterium]|nr:TIGR02117 family protein [Planctomycetota bacterium]
MPRFLRALGWAVGLLLVAPLLAWGLASLVLGAWRTGARPPPGPDNVRVVLESNGQHVSLWFPTVHPLHDWRAEFPIAHTRAGAWIDEVAPDSWISIGWGDRRFYLEVEFWSDLTAEIALSAVFGGGSSALHVEHAGAPPVWELSREVELSPAQYRLLVNFVRDSFRRDAAGNVVQIEAAAYASSDAFYEGVGSYSPWRTCNEWVSRGLRAAGAPAGAWTPFAYQVLGNCESAVPAQPR